MSSYLTSTDAASTYQTQSGMSNYYTKTEVDGEIVGAINDLDVPAVGGSTKYITTISEANGLIDATPASPDTVPTLDSSKLITSGGVKTYVDNAKTAATNTIPGAVFGMGQNTYIPEDTTGINLNNYTAPGIYIKQFSTNVSTFLNTPFQEANANYGFSVAAFKLIVEYYNSENNIRQTLIPLYENTGYFVRTRMTGSGGTWKPWVYYSGNYALSYGLTITATQDNPFDLDDLKTIGRYNYGSSSTDYISSFPSDLPTTGGGTIIVENNQLVDRFTQTIFLNSKANAGKFWKRNFTSDGWSPWYRFEGTQVPAPAAQQLSGNELRGAVEEERGEDSPVEDEPQDER